MYQRYQPPYYLEASSTKRKKYKDHTMTSNNQYIKDKRVSEISSERSLNDQTNERRSIA